MDNTILGRLQRRVKDLESAEIKTQYSRDGSYWHASCASGDTCMRISSNGGETWGVALAINRTGEKSDYGKGAVSGKGVASGGEEGQILTKKSGADYDTVWKSITTADIPDITDKKYVSDNQLNVLSNTSNINTGDETEASIKSKLGITVLSGVNTGDQMLSDLGGIPLSQKGNAGGVAELDSNGHIPQSQLPSYVDDVLDYSSLTAFPATGESGKIYVADDTNRAYRWSGSSYSVISPTLALGETMSTAYRGDRGKTAYNHSQAAGNPHGTTKTDLGLGNVTNDAQVIAAGSAVADGNIALFNGTEGNRIKDSSKKISDFMLVGAVRDQYSQDAASWHDTPTTADNYYHRSYDSGSTYGDPVYYKGAGNVNGAASSVDGDIALFNGSDGKIIKDAGYAPSNLLKCINRQDNITNNSVSNQLIQIGWGYVVGPNSASYITKAISFPVTFENVPIILVNYLGYKTSMPASETDFSIGTQYAYGIQPTTSGFTVAIYSRDSATNLTSSYYYGYSWIAIGTKIR